MTWASASRGLKTVSARLSKRGCAKTAPSGDATRTAGRTFYTQPVSETCARCFLHQAAPPFTDLQKQYLHYWLARKRKIEGVAPTDIEVLNRLVDQEGPHYFLKRDDLVFTAVSSIFIGVA